MFLSVKITSPLGRWEFLPLLLKTIFNFSSYVSYTTHWLIISSASLEWLDPIISCSNQKSNTESQQSAQAQRCWWEHLNTWIRSHPRQDLTESESQLRRSDFVSGQILTRSSKTQLPSDNLPDPDMDPMYPYSRPWGNWFKRYCY